MPPGHLHRRTRRSAKEADGEAEGPSGAMAPEIEAQITANCESVVNKMSTLYKGSSFDFSFDLPSVEKVDEMIDRNRRTWIREGSGDRMMAMFGSYLGEALINEYGGKWVEGYGIEIQEGFVARPFVKVGKRIVNGIEEDSCASYYSMISNKLAEFESSGEQ